MARNRSTKRQKREKIASKATKKVDIDQEEVENKEEGEVETRTTKSSKPLKEKAKKVERQAKPEVDEDDEEGSISEESGGTEESDEEEEMEEKDEEDDEEEDEEEEGEAENDDEMDEEEEETESRTKRKRKSLEAVDPPSPTFVSDGRYRNKQRCLVLCSRGVTARYRHLLEDLRTLLPHHKKESKLDPGSEGAGRAVNDIAEMRSCNTVLFLECRKRQDAYLWMGRVGENAGPSVRFHVSNIHTMDELRLTGNCMKGSRPILSFDQSFDKFDHLKLLKALFIQVFGTPRGHPKSKPFVDRVMAFYYADKKIWVRNYQIQQQQATNAKEAHLAKKESGQAAGTSLVEIGPRFVLNPIRIFRGSFGGQTLYKNDNYVAPNTIRSTEKKDKGNAYKNRKMSQKRRKERKSKLVLPEDPLDSVFR